MPQVWHKKKEKKKKKNLLKLSLSLSPTEWHLLYEAVSELSTGNKSFPLVYSGDDLLMPLFGHCPEDRKHVSAISPCLEQGAPRIQQVFLICLASE